METRNKLYVASHFNSINKNYINNTVWIILTMADTCYREQRNKYKQIKNKTTYLWGRDNKNSYRNRDHELSRGPLNNHG